LFSRKQKKPFATKEKGEKKTELEFEAPEKLVNQKTQP
jgi:hypothetical protein